MQSVADQHLKIQKLFVLFSKRTSFSHLGNARGVLLHLPDPSVHALEAPLVGDVVHQEDPLRPPRVAPDDGAEPALAARVPDLQLDPLPVNQDSSRLIGCKDHH